MRLAPPSRHVRLAVALAVVAGLAACALPQKPPEDDITTCRPAAPGDALVGSWLSIRKERGIAGELQTLFVLNADGTMAYAERLKRGRQPSQGLSETGCWQREGEAFKLRTLASNGSPVDPRDPIYVNTYQVERSSGTNLVVQHQGNRLEARKMPPDYRLPL